MSLKLQKNSKEPHFAVRGHVIGEADHHNRASLLHEDLAQLLAAFRLHLSTLRNECVGNIKLNRRIEMLDQLMGQAFALLRRIAIELYPLAGEDNSLYYALRSLMRSFSEQHGVTCKLIAEEENLDIGNELGLPVFRIVQSTIEHIARSTPTGEILVKLRRKDDKLTLAFFNQAETQVVGTGARDAKAYYAVPALHSVRDQVKQLHGKSRLVKVPGRGMRFEISVPLYSPTLQ